MTPGLREGTFIHENRVDPIRPNVAPELARVPKGFWRCEQQAPGIQEPATDGVLGGFFAGRPREQLNLYAVFAHIQNNELPFDPTIRAERQTKRLSRLDAIQRPQHLRGLPEIARRAGRYEIVQLILAAIRNGHHMIDVKDRPLLLARSAVAALETISVQNIKAQGR